jgi:hypothetical protein
MGPIKHPGGSDSVTPQMSGGPKPAHPRGTDAKSGDTARKMARERAAPGIDPDTDRKPSGPDAHETLGGRSDEIANPGIGSSAGTTDSGERGVAERDRGAGIDRNE